MIHQPVGAYLEFPCFFSFCSDFGIIQKNFKPNDLKTILVVIEKMNFRMEGEVQYLTFHQFVEAIFVVSYSQLLLPTKTTLDGKQVESLYKSLEKIEQEMEKDPISDENHQQSDDVDKSLDKSEEEDEEKVKQEDIKHLEHFLSCIKIPTRKYEVFRVIEDRRKKNMQKDTRYWDEIFKKLNTQATETENNIKQHSRIDI